MKINSELSIETLIFGNILKTIYVYNPNNFNDIK